MSSDRQLRSSIHVNEVVCPRNMIFIMYLHIFMTLFIGSQSFISLPSFMFVSFIVFPPFLGPILKPEVPF